MAAETHGPGVAGSTAPAMPTTIALGWARTKIELRQFFRERDSVVFTLSFPVLLLFIFGSVFTDDIAPGVSFTQYFAAGMIASGVVVSSFQSLAISIAIERDDGTLKRLRGTPMPSVSYFLGKIGLVAVTSAVQTVVLLVVGVLLFGLDLPARAGAWLDFAWIFVLGSAAGTVLGIAFSSLARSGRSAPAVVTPVVLVLQFTSGVFFVFSDLPGWMQAVASVFPLRWLAGGMRSVFLPASFEAQEVGGSWHLGLAAVVLALWLVVGLLLASRTFRWTRRDDG